MEESEASGVGNVAHVPSIMVTDATLDGDAPSPSPIGEAPPPSPPSPEVKKQASSRRSSIATARRMSRASVLGAGIPLADLLGTVPREGEAALVERLQKMVALCVNSTVRQVEVGLQAEESSAEEGAREVGKVLRLTEGRLGEGVVEGVAARMEGGLLQQEEVMGEARRRVREHTVRLKEEHKLWREVIGERKEQQRRAESNARMAGKGELVVKEDRRYSLTQEERARLDKVPDGTDTLEHLRKHREQQELLAQSAATAAKRLKRKIEEMDAELGRGARDLIARADQAGGRLESLGPQDLLEFQCNMDE